MELNYKGIEVRAAEGLHDDCMAALKRYVPPGSKVLDLAAGRGAFASRAADEGYRVTANDIDQSEWIVPGVPKTSADLNDSIDSVMGGEKYDAVVAMEVIEHLNSPPKLLRDCRNLLAPGGVILISTPNVLDLESRLIYLRSGATYHINPRSFFDTGHRVILPCWLLELFFDEARLEVTEKQWGGVVPRQPDATLVRKVVRSVSRRLARLLVTNATKLELESNYVIYVLRPN